MQNTSDTMVKKEPIKPNELDGQKKFNHITDKTLDYDFINESDYDLVKDNQSLSDSSSTVGEISELTTKSTRTTIQLANSVSV